jgi:2'-5' RNA ligase
VADSPHEHSSTQVQLPDDIAAAIKRFHIKPEHLGEEGREKDPHVTVRYGLHADDPDVVRDKLKDETRGEARLGKTSLFQNDDADVLKVDVNSPDLHRLHEKLGSLPHTDTHPDYHPHATIAYLRPGTGRHYEGKEVPGATGETAPIHSVRFSSKHGDKADIHLSPAGRYRSYRAAK